MAMPSGLGKVFASETKQEKTSDMNTDAARIQMCIRDSLPPYKIAEQTIDKTYDFFRNTMRMPMTLREVGIDESRLKEIAAHIATNEGLDNPSIFAPLTEKDIYEILETSL